MQSVALHVNGQAVTVETDDPDMPLLYALRNELDLHAARFSCGLGQCGICTVHIDGEAVHSCTTPLSALGPNQKIVTLEGLSSLDKLHPVHQAFIAKLTAQCDYCLNGMIMQSAALLAKTSHPSEAQIHEALSKILCRCGLYPRIVLAVQRAAAL